MPDFGLLSEEALFPDAALTHTKNYAPRVIPKVRYF